MSRNAVADFNAYLGERAVAALEAEGFRNLADDDAIAYYFNGEGGTLDYAFANSALAGQVTGATIWNINSPEAYSIEYDGGDFAAFGDLSPHASSDHDPVIVGRSLDVDRTLAEADGETFSALPDGKALVLGGAGFTRSSVTTTDVMGGRRFEIDSDGDGAADASFTVEGDFRRATSCSRRWGPARRGAPSSSMSSSRRRFPKAGRRRRGPQRDRERQFSHRRRRQELYPAPRERRYGGFRQCPRRL